MVLFSLSISFIKLSFTHFNRSHKITLPTSSLCHFDTHDAAAADRPHAVPVGRRDGRVRRVVEGRLQRVEHVPVGAAHLRAPPGRPLLCPGRRLPAELLGKAVRPRRRREAHPVLLDQRRGHLPVRQQENGQGPWVEGKGGRETLRLAA